MRQLKAFGLAALCAFAHGARAEPNDYVLVPNVVYGERELELLLGSAAGPPGPRDSVASLALGLSPAAFWATELYANYDREGGAGARFDGVEWENRFQLTEPGEYVVDWGAAVELHKYRLAREGWDASFVGMMQGEATGRIEWNFNPVIDVTWSGVQPSATQLQYQLQVKYRYQPVFEFGAQGFGNFGPWYHWLPLDRQSHELGPAIFGKTSLGPRQVLVYNAGWLLGLDPKAPHSTLRAQLELEF